MELSIALFTACCLVTVDPVASVEMATKAELLSLTAKVGTLETKIASLSNDRSLLTRQLMMQQFYVEEMTRSNGNSGLKQIRLHQFGHRPFRSANHVDHYIAAIHNHGNNKDTIGLGESVMVLNGIEFRTRHNDYRLWKKHSTKYNFRVTEPIVFPDVPPDVTGTVTQQVTKMKQWFKAFKDQDSSVKDYRQYFKPVLCYMEGYWYLPDDGKLDEPFDSDRHQIDAKNWLDLQEKIRFHAYSGGKISSENLAYLPTTVIDQSDGSPILAQWNYRILCQPLKDDLPLSLLRPVNDTKTKISFKFTDENYNNSRSARFMVVESEDTLEERGVHSIMDRLMEQVPGMDNDMAALTDDVNGELAYTLSGDELLNTGYYHRVYKVKENGASGLKVRHRSFADENLFVARTTQTKIPKLKVENCVKNVCSSWKHGWSYAIPLEIIYLTPLSKWNPYNFVDRGAHNSYNGKQVKANGADGTEAKPYNGFNSKIFYHTPYNLFQDSSDSQPADTTLNAVYVKNKDGDVFPARGSGHRIHLPEIPGVGVIRQRYPIMPIHGEGSGVWKELSALQEILLNPKKYNNLAGIEFLHEAPENPDKAYMIWTKPSNPKDGSHRHSLVIQENDVKNAIVRATVRVAKGKGTSAKKSEKANKSEKSNQSSEEDDESWYIDLITEMERGHEHLIRLKCNDGNLVIASCDGKKNKCADGHKGLEGDLDDICDIISDTDPTTT